MRAISAAACGSMSPRRTSAQASSGRAASRPVRSSAGSPKASALWTSSGFARKASTASKGESSPAAEPARRNLQADFGAPLLQFVEPQAQHPFAAGEPGGRIGVEAGRGVLQSFDVRAQRALARGEGAALAGDRLQFGLLQALEAPGDHLAAGVGGRRALLGQQIVERGARPRDIGVEPADLVRQVRSPGARQRASPASASAARAASSVVPSGIAEGDFGERRALRVLGVAQRAAVEIGGGVGRHARRRLAGGGLVGQRALDRLANVRMHFGRGLRRGGGAAGGLLALPGYTPTSAARAPAPLTFRPPWPRRARP